MADRSGWVQALLSWTKFEQGINDAPWLQTDQDALFSRCFELSNRYPDMDDVRSDPLDGGQSGC